MSEPSTRSLERAAQAWCAPTTENRTMDPPLAVEFARILDEETSAPLLGLATTRELLTELEVRMRVTQNSTNGRELGRLCAGALENLATGVLDYRTVGPF